jgi:hypothetical protein
MVATSHVAVAPPLLQQLAVTVLKRLIALMMMARHMLVMMKAAHMIITRTSRCLQRLFGLIHFEKTEFK